MEVSSKTVRGTFFRMWARLCGSDLAQKYAGDELPLRSELFSCRSDGAAWQDPCGLCTS